MPNYAVDLEIDRVDLVDEGANSAAFIKLYKRKESSKDMNIEEILGAMKPEHAEFVTAELAKAKNEVPETIAKTLLEKEGSLAKALADLVTANEEKAVADEKVAELEKAKGAQPTEEEELMKSLNPAAQALFKSMKTKVDAAEAVTKATVEKQQHEEAVVKAKELKAIPLSEEKLVAVVKTATPEVFEALKAASIAIETGSQLDEFGKGSRNETSDAWQKIDKMATELAKSADGKITHQAAIAKVVKDHPELYREYVNGGVK